MSTGGGGYINVGGISADARIETGNLDADLAKVQSGLGKVAEAIKRWQQQLDAGKISTSQFDAAIGPLIARQDELRAAYDRVTQAMAANAAAMQRGGAAAQTMATATRSVHTGMAGVNDGTKKAGYGLLLLSQAIEDAQYGFSAVVNNMPGIVMAFGGSAGLAGGVSLAAVAVNTWVHNWEHVTDLMKDTSWVDAATQGFQQVADAALSYGATIANLSPVTLTTKDIKALTDQKAAEAKRAKEAVKGTEAAEGIEEKGADERAAAFKKASAGFGGGDVLLSQALAAGKREGGTKETLRRREQQIRRAFLEATHGNAQAIQALGARVPGFGEKYDLYSPETTRRIDQANAAEQSNIEAGAREGAERDKEEMEAADLAEERFQESLKHIGSQARAKNLERARLKAPGAEQVAERLALISRASGGALSMDEVSSQISGYLRDKGLSEHQARVVGIDMGRTAARKVEGDIVGAEVNPELRKSQVFDATDLAATIQSGVGNQDNVKQLIKLAAMTDKNIDAIARKVETMTGIKFTVKH